MPKKTVRPVRILFLCVENAGRSQMAEAFARRYAPPGVEVFSAGSRPAPHVHPAVAEVMREAGFEIGDRVPKGLAELPEGTFNLVVGMGCGDACPVACADKFLPWEIPNPKEQPPERVRRIRDQIDLKVLHLMDEIRPGRMRRWPTILSGLVLLTCCAFLLLVSLAGSPALEVPFPERGLALVAGRTLALREALARLSPWERRFHAFLDPGVGGPQEISDLLRWHQEFIRLSKNPAILANLPGIMTDAGIVEGESGRRELLDKQTQDWISKAPLPVPIYGLLLRCAYFGEPAPLNWSGLLHELLPPGWLRNRMEERIAGADGENARAQRIRQANLRFEKRLLAGYRLMSGLDWGILLFFLAALALYFRKPSPFWRIGSASIPLPWTFPHGMAVLIRGTALGMALAFLPSLLPHPSDSFSLLFIYVLWTLPVLFWSWRHLPGAGGLGQAVGLRVPAGKWRKFLLILLIGLGADSMGGWLLGWAGLLLHIPGHWAESFDVDLVWGTRSAVWTAVAGMALIGPFFEELVFRGLLYGTLRGRFGRAAAALLSAAFFSLLHGYGLLGFLTVFWSGVVFAWVYEESGSLLPAIAVHGAGNLLFALNVLVMLRLA